MTLLFFSLWGIPGTLGITPLTSLKVSLPSLFFVAGLLTALCAFLLWRFEQPRKISLPGFWGSGPIIH